MRRVNSLGRSLRLTLGCGLITLFLCSPALRGAQPAAPFVPVGVRHKAGADRAEGHQAFLEMNRLRFTIVEFAGTGEPSASREIARLDRLLAGATDERVPLDGLHSIVVSDLTGGSEVWQAAWSAIAQGHRGVVFEDWASLSGNADARSAAAEFAGHMSRNAALYAPLRPREAPGRPDVTIAGGNSHLEVAFLESTEALVMIVLNTHTTEPQSATLTFAPEMPEAIWQNMITGGAVNFVAGPKGPTYTPALEPSGVLVLMIRKTWR